MIADRPEHLQRLAHALDRIATNLESQMGAADFQACANDPSMPADYRQRMAAIAEQRRREGRP